MSAPAVEVRAATESDLLAIAGLHLLSWKTSYADVLPASALDFDPSDPKVIENSVRGWEKTLQTHPGNLSVAIGASTDILGFCCAGPVDDLEKNYPYRFQVYGLHVRPGYHRRGIGTRLLTDAFKRAARLDMRSVIVWTPRHLEQSRRFYERSGGQLEKEGKWRISDIELEEVAYGWLV